MAQYFLYEEIVNREPTPIEDLTWLAGQVLKLPAFTEGVAVLCGSAAWGCHSWRSDIDVAHFKTIACPDIIKPIEAIIADYRTRTGDRFILPRVEVTTIGAESEQLVEKMVGSGYGMTLQTTKRKVTKVIADTAFRFADHIGSLAALKGEPWQTFHKTYLSSIETSQGVRRKGLKSYVSSVAMGWRSQPLHQLNTGPDGHLTQAQLNLIARAENFPTHLMRRILGELSCYPSPDRGSDIHAAFSLLPEPWAKGLVAGLEPFHRLEERYEEIIAAARDSGNRLTASQYYSELRSLACDLPFTQIEEKVWDYLNERQQLEEKEEQGRLEATRQREEIQRQREEEQLRARLETQRRHEEEAHRAYLLTKSKLPRWLRWIW